VQGKGDEREIVLEKGNTFKQLVCYGNNGELPHGRFRSRLRISVKMGVEEKENEDMDWINLAQNTIQLQVIVDIKGSEFFTS
jgi:hypothetical protein